MVSLGLSHSIKVLHCCSWQNSYIGSAKLFMIHFNTDYIKLTSKGISSQSSRAMQVNIILITIFIFYMKTDEVENIILRYETINLTKPKKYRSTFFSNYISKNKTFENSLSHLLNKEIFDANSICKGADYCEDPSYYPKR